MRNEKVPLIIAVVSGAVAFAFYMFGVGAAAGALAVVAVVAAVIFAEAKWHNLHHEELEDYKKALRDVHEKGPGEDDDREGGRS